MGSKGYNAVKWLRNRDEEKRGGQAKTADGLDRSNSGMTTHAERYIDWLKIRSQSEHTLRTKWEDLVIFLKWAEERGQLKPEQITRAILESYQRHLWYYRKKNGNPIGRTTQRKRLSVVKGFFSRLAKERVIETNPAGEIELPPFIRRLPMETPTIAEVESILAMPDITDPLGIRDRAILETFYSTGIRRGALVRLKIYDLNREKHIINIHQGKGNKDRVVPVGSRAFHWLEKYLDNVRPLLAVDTTNHDLFITCYGTAFSPNVLSRIVTRYIRHSGVGKKGGCHMFRHACATHMLEGGADIRYIQQLLGHASLDTTSIYTQVNITKLQEVHASCHPAEKNKPARSTKSDPKQ